MRAYVRSSHLEHQPSRFKLFEEYYNDEGSDDLRQFLRFSRADFDSLHETLRANLEKPRNHRYPISSKHRLAVFLRFIGHGPSFKAMETSFGIGYTTVYKIILEVAHAVLDSSLQLPLPTTDDLVASAKEFERSWNFPNCIAALDGKHIRTKAPDGGGSLFFNHKDFHSLVGLAWVDAHYRFLFFDVGAPGRRSDSSIYNDSPIPDLIRRMLPADREVDNELLPYVVVADQGFALTRYVLRPYGRHEAVRDKVKSEFNYRLSRARRVSENCFGIMASRFRILQCPLQMNADNARDVVAAIAVLHNFLRTKEMERGEDVLELLDGHVNAGAFESLPELGSRQASQQGRQIRQKFAQYFYSPSGQLSHRDYA
ncbi:hypothetical protein QR680_017248 [Steinernema hermaphroditum]|uniref:DDE Tnp4 domain-containing protein n=1 Tax=Steinernema hermaphroditum TaxID=289476 RepID=A0AA39HEE6_9BILA|nr:hypothetical protein QR680_017248 [Steinernema hermaphroditum]